MPSCIFKLAQLAERIKYRNNKPSNEGKGREGGGGLWKDS